MTSDRIRKRLPPYVSYRTFHNFLEGLLQGIPARIDRSYWGDRLSGSTGIQLVSALRFLGLIDVNGLPTARLKQLVAAKGTLRSEQMKDMTTEAYSFLLGGSFDPQTATYAQLQEVFHYIFQLSGDVSRKCIKFFLALANDAGIPLSPFVTKRMRASHTTSGTRTITKKTSKTIRNLMIPQKTEEIPARTSWDTMLLTKFPTFDPNWSDEVKMKWFDAFDQLLKRGFLKSQP